MSANETILSAEGMILKLVVVCVLASYLLSKHRQRLRDLPPTEDPPEWTGKTIDATKLKPAVDRIRKDYVAAGFQQPDVISYRRSLVALAVHAIRNLSFFRERNVEEHAHESATQTAIDCRSVS